MVVCPCMWAAVCACMSVSVCMSRSECMSDPPIPPPEQQMVDRSFTPSSAPHPSDCLQHKRGRGFHRLLAYSGNALVVCLSLFPCYFVFRLILCWRRLAAPSAVRCSVLIRVDFVSLNAPVPLYCKSCGKPISVRGCVQTRAHPHRDAHGQPRSLTHTPPLKRAPHAGAHTHSLWRTSTRTLTQTLKRVRTDTYMSMHYTHINTHTVTYTTKTHTHTHHSVRTCFKHGNPCVRTHPLWQTFAYAHTSTRSKNGWSEEGQRNL